MTWLWLKTLKRISRSNAVVHNAREQVLRVHPCARQASELSVVICAEPENLRLTTLSDLESAKPLLKQSYELS